MRQAAIGFKSKGNMLEGVLAVPQGLPGPHPAVLLCHPHPALGGSMDSPVLMAVARAADGAGFATLRFNFRGVGGSEGEFSNGEREHEDIRSALEVLRRWPGIDGKRLALMGYSFGASVVLNGLRHYKAARGLALIAPPVSSLRSPRLKNDKRPKLFVAGQKDRVATSVEVQAALDGIQGAVQFREIALADHALGDHEDEVAEAVVAFAVESIR